MSGSNLSSPTIPYTPANVFGSSGNAPNPATHVFFGFSTYDSASTGNTKLFDIDLINRDLLNSFYTRVGERVMRPDWGCKIWDWLMDPLTESLYDQVVTEVVRICELDSRLAVLNTQVYKYQNGLRIEMTLRYQPFNVVNTFTASFETQQTNYFDNTSDF